MTQTVDSLLAGARRRLAAAAFAPSTREAGLLLGHVLGLTEAGILAHGERRVTAPEAQRFDALLARRLAGEPVAYLLGEKEFWGRVFAVDDRVLIPRPETEHLVAAALELSLPEGALILDVGTGSGCIGVTLALEIGGARVVATDASPAAAALAARNAERLGAGERLLCVVADLAAPVSLAAVDLVVSNPPYIATGDAAALSPEITGHEPSAALFAGDDGLALLRRLLSGLEGLRAGTPVLVEIGAGQEEAVVALMAEAGFTHRSTRADYGGIQRIVVGSRR